MLRKFIWFSACMAVALLPASSPAQEEVFQRGTEFGIGARALGMGGAYIGVGDDYSAAFWNPAALTQIRRIEGFGTLSHAQRKNEAAYLSDGETDKASYTRFNSLGLAYPIPTYRGSLVFSLGFHRVRPYDSNFSFSWFNNTSEDSVQQRWSELEEGSLNNWTFALATEVAPNFSVGAALNAWSGKNDYQFSFVEEDVLDLYYFADYRKDKTVGSEFSGFNLKLAGMYHPSSLLRLGFTLATPTTIKVKESWTDAEEGVDELPAGGTESWAESESGQFDYKIRSPFSLAAGAAVNFAGLLVSGSVEHNDWSQIRYQTEPPIEGLSRSKANDELARNYRATTRLRLGAEFNVPVIDLQLRAGYFYDPTPLANLPSDANREFLTAGFGIFLDKQVRLDLAIVTGSWRDYKAPLSDFGYIPPDGTEPVDVDYVPVAEKIRLNQALATLAFRF